MKISNNAVRNRALITVVVVSLGLHLVALLIFGTWKIVESITREEESFEAPAIVQLPQVEPEYVVNLEQRNRSSAPPRPNPIVVKSPDVSIPALNIDVNIADSSSYGQGAGGFGSGGLGKMREMALDLDSLEFFGKKMKTDAKRMMFVIDISGSMIMEQRGIDGYKEVVKEVVRTLKTIEGVGSFNIIGFSKETTTFSGSFVGATDSSVARAKKWLLELDPAHAVKNAKTVPEFFKAFAAYKNGQHGGTQTGLALELAFKKRSKMIILLSDGEPTTDKAEIHASLEKMQKKKKIPINTVSYKSQKGRKFLEKIAEDSGGEYVTVQ